MIVFPITLFYFTVGSTGFKTFTGFYDSYELYTPGFLDIFKSGVVLQSGEKTYTTGAFGFFTGKSFISTAIFADDFEAYNAGLNFTTYPSGSGYFLGSRIYDTGYSFYTDTYLTDTYESYSAGLIFSFPDAVYTGKGYYGKVETGHSYAGYIRPLAESYPISIKNLTSIGPAYFTGSGILMTGDWDRVNNRKIGYLNRNSGLFFFDHMFMWDKGSTTFSGFTIEMALRRSGWAVASSRPFDGGSSPSGTILQRNATTDNMRAGISGSFDNSTATLRNDEWTFISFVRSGTEGRFYFSGRLSNVVTLIGNTVTQSIPFYLGRRVTNVPQDLQYWGYIDEFRFWNYPLPSGQIFSGSTGTVDPNSPGLQCYLSLGF